MSDGEEPAGLPDRPTEYPSEREHGLSLAGIALAIGWLVVPAIQYFGAVQRVPYSLRRVEELPLAADWDLTPLYLLLLLLTVIHWVRGWLARERVPEDQVIATEQGGSA